MECHRMSRAKHLKSVEFIVVWVVVTLLVNGGWSANAARIKLDKLVKEVDEESCPQADYSPVRLYQSTTPVGGSLAGNYSKVNGDQTVDTCLHACCLLKRCDAMFYHDKSCFHISCFSDALCKPHIERSATFRNSFLAQVRSVSFRTTTSRLTDGDNSVDTASPLSVVHANEQPYYDISSILQPNIFERRSGTEPKIPSLPRPCRVGMDPVECGDHEHCVSTQRRGKGTCVCMEGFERDGGDNCIQVFVPSSTSEPMAESPGEDTTQAMSKVKDAMKPSPAVTVMSEPVTLTPVPVTPISSTATVISTDLPPPQLTIVVQSNLTITLPQNSTSIVATVQPVQANDTYKYEWSFVSKPEGEELGVMTGSNSPVLQLANLRPGRYVFKVSVTSGHAHGEKLVNVTVLPAKHTNRSPVAIIKPLEQTVQLPNKDTVLDGSSSTDDTEVIDYKWEPMTLPIGFQSPFGLELNNTKTLQLKNLIPGFYQFKLTVIDADHAENSTVANVTVLKEKDYPPTANAGADVILKLPKNEVTLNGNQSTDDKNIIGWQWTRAPDDEKSLAVDMDGTVTPYLHLSKLELGMYKFLLKVTDTANQTSTAEVHVFVQPQQFKGPEAVVQPPIELNLPIEVPIYLDGAKSTDDSPEGLVKYNWLQVEGPKNANIANCSWPKTEVMGLIPGKYIFQLTVTNGRGSNSSANATITVTQSKNTPPRANAGGDQVITLPQSVVILNGSRSWDDFAILNWTWTRTSKSLAAGRILKGTDKGPVLELTDLIPGVYGFTLTVMDKQGESSSNEVTLTVKPPIDLLNRVEATLDTDIESFSFEQESTTLKRLELLLNDGKGTPLKVNKVSLESIPITKRVFLVFTADTGKELAPGPEVVRKLKIKLRSNMNLIEPGLLSLETVVCQNNCSGHGRCDQVTRRCKCESFWMENVFGKVFTDIEPNCDWSVLYVVIISFLVLVGSSVLLWTLACFLTKKPSRVVLKEAMKPFGRGRRRRTRATTRSQNPVNYMLLSNKDAEEDNSDQKGSRDKDLLGLNDLDSGLNGDFEVVKKSKRQNSLTKKHNSRIYSSTDSGGSSEDVTIFDSSLARRSSKSSKPRRGSGSSVNGLVSSVRPHVRA